jgi:thiamine biosynthesis lipoprotein
MSGPTMGTRWSAIVTTRPSLPRASIEAALQSAVDLVDQQMSTWRPESDLMRFNRAPVGQWIELPQPLCDVVALGLQIGRDSEGAFNIGMGVQVAAWGFGAAPRTPDPASVDDAQMSALPLDPDVLELDLARRRLRRHSNVLIDLSGIAKGYGVDCLADVLDAHGIKNYLVSIDGEVRAAGVRTDHTGWIIGLERPVKGTRDVARTIEVSDMALATSGDYRHWREHDGATISHTIDPRTGRPLVNRVAAVTVTAATCAAADAWATALMVLGEDEGPAKAREFGLDALFTERQAGDLVEIAVGGFNDIDNEPIRRNGE